MDIGGIFHLWCLLWAHVFCFRRMPRKSRTPRSLCIRQNDDREYLAQFWLYKNDYYSRAIIKLGKLWENPSFVRIIIMRKYSDCRFRARPKMFPRFQGGLKLDGEVQYCTAVRVSLVPFENYRVRKTTRKCGGLSTQTPSQHEGMMSNYGTVLFNVWAWHESWANRVLLATLDKQQ